MFQYQSLHSTNVSSFPPGHRGTFWSILLPLGTVVSSLLLTGIVAITLPPSVLLQSTTSPHRCHIVPFPHLSPLPLPLSPLTPYYACLYPAYARGLSVFVPLPLANLAQRDVLQIHPQSSKWHDFLFSHGLTTGSIPLCVYSIISLSSHLFLGTWLVSRLGLL